MKKADRIAKCTSKLITGVIMAFGFMIFCPLFSSNVSASSADTIISFPAISEGTIRIDNHGSSSAVNYYDFNDVAFNASRLAFRDLTIEQTGSVVLKYDAFAFSYFFSGQKYNGNACTITDASGLQYNVVMNLVLRRGTYPNFEEEYIPLDLNGGHITIQNPETVNAARLSAVGNVNGRAVFNTTYVYYGCITFASPALDFYIADDTIVDSEGTVWTVPAGVKNPVVIRTGSNEFHKYLVDAVSGLGCFKNPLDPSKYVFGSKEYIDVVLYDLDLISHRLHADLETAEQFGIEPVYTTTRYSFTEFLYGSLPEIEVTPLSPEPTDPPAPTDPPSGEEPVPSLGSFKIGSSQADGFVYEQDVNIGGGLLVFYSKHVNFEANVSEPDSNKYTWYATIEDRIPKYIGRLDLNCEVDGYVSMSFPDIWLFPDMVYPRDVIRDFTFFPPDNENYYLGFISEYFDSRIFLDANGERFYINQYGGSVRVPVNSGDNVMLMGIELYVKDEFISNHFTNENVIYHALLDDFVINIREYKEQSAADIEEIKDALQNFPGGDKMDEDISNLGGAMKDYDDVNNSIFESAGSGMDGFDMTTGLQFNGKLLSAIAFLSTIIANIIMAMGDYSILYTVGACLLLACILFGLFKYYGGDDK